MVDLLSLSIFIIAVGGFAAFIYWRVKQKKTTKPIPPIGGDKPGSKPK